MLKYITEKLIGQILPSVVATVIGAYVVNQYIARPNTPPAAHEAKVDAARAEAAKAASGPGAAALTATIPEAEKADFIKVDQPGRTDTAKAKSSADKPSLRHSIARDKAAEKAEKATADKAAAEKASADKLAADKAAADKAAAEKALAEKAAAKPAVATAAPEPAKTQDERREANRDPNDLVRAAVERLRASELAKPLTEVTSRAPEPLKVPDTVKAAEPLKAPKSLRAAQEQPRSTGALQPLPPPVNVAGPAASSMTTGASIVGAAPTPRTTVDASYDGPRIAPPADIPTAAEAAPAPKPSVAEDVLFAAKSVFHAVLPR